MYPSLQLDWIKNGNQILFIFIPLVSAYTVHVVGIQTIVVIKGMKKEW